MQDLLFANDDALVACTMQLLGPKDKGDFQETVRQEDSYLPNYHKRHYQHTESFYQRCPHTILNISGGDFMAVSLISKPCAPSMLFPASHGFKHHCSPIAFFQSSCMAISFFYLATRIDEI
ncbi:hypothetical protein PoB_006509500 [Plakobranchus ocellatus]|uniref:Uncharacterized protein n=1 Tax=Plakobranchus ocellatus TaxID=259542 RepID=A0AAV4D377_9GAST|nr:hypothetical protein PoB_006509500 [Plakobranchus ocellatus]